MYMPRITNFDELEKASEYKKPDEGTKTTFIVTDTEWVDGSYTNKKGETPDQFHIVLEPTDTNFRDEYGTQHEYFTDSHIVGSVYGEFVRRINANGIQIESEEFIEILNKEMSWEFISMDFGKMQSKLRWFPVFGGTVSVAKPSIPDLALDSLKKLLGEGTTRDELIVWRGENGILEAVLDQIMMSWKEEGKLSNEDGVYTLKQDW